MSTNLHATVDGNEAAAMVAYQLSEVIAIYPITPSSAMGELADEWATQRKPNLWGSVPTVVEMQSEGGAAGAVHGALQTGSLCTTFTASQGLLLMIPNMYKIAGELTPTVFHVASRAIATHALSIFGDHSDVMATRGTGWGMLASGSPQEAQDFALIAHVASLEARIPFVHFFDGFRTSHEINRIQLLADHQIREMIDDEVVQAHRRRALSPEHPFIRGTAQNPDVFFQAREASNPFYGACSQIVETVMRRFAAKTGRRYQLYQYHGAPDADRVIVLMGSGAEVAHETVDCLLSRGEKIGVLKVRLFRPFVADRFVAALPPTVKSIAVLDRTKEPGSNGEPLYLDVVTALSQTLTAGQSSLSTPPRIIGGRYGLASKEFTPAMIKAVFEELARDHPKTPFTVGIQDDVTQTSLEHDSAFSTEAPETMRAVFFGLGSDGTVGANKNSIKIIGEETDLFAQGYFVYDSKKSGSVTISHLRFGPHLIRSSYLIREANFVACHQFSFLERMDIMGLAAQGATVLLNSPYPADKTWDRLPRHVQLQILSKRVRLFVIDGYELARETGMGGRFSTIMQTCFFALSNVIPRNQAIAAIKLAIQKSYGKFGEAVVERNNAAVDLALEHLHEVKIPEAVTGEPEVSSLHADGAPDFVRLVTRPMINGQGNNLPVSTFPPDGTFPSSTSRWEKRNIALEIPVWDPDLCIQCGKCVLACPHAVIRAKVSRPENLAQAPPTFRSAPARWQSMKDRRYRLQVAPEDCTGCAVCVQVCPVKNKSEARRKAINMQPQAPLRATETVNWEFFLNLPEADREELNDSAVKDVQLLQPLFEFPGACAGCGETPYLKLLSQLFGDRALIANATGCSSIYGGNLPTTPWSCNRAGRGPAWSNSLFEDNAEFGLGMRLSLDNQLGFARVLLNALRGKLGDDLVDKLLNASQSSAADITSQRERIAELKMRLETLDDREARNLLPLADSLLNKSVWIVGGDGWAYDIGYGGLDHVLASGRKVNVLVLDTEVYSNTGGQSSKATPRGAVAKFASGGKSLPKKDLAMMAMSYGSVYVARVALGANDTHTIKVFLEAEAFPGPALIIAYSHCIAHGFNLAHGMEQQKAAVQSGYWPLFRFNPAWARVGKNPLQLDSGPPTIDLEKYAYNETRYTMLAQSDPIRAKPLLEDAREDVVTRWKLYEHLAAMKTDSCTKEAKP